MLDSKQKDRNIKNAKKKRKRVETLLKEVKVTRPSIKNKNNLKEDKNKDISSDTEEKDSEFHERILEEDIGFVAPVLNENQPRPIKESNLNFSLEETASEFIPQESQSTKIDNGLDYAGKKTGGNYSGSGDYALVGSALYSTDVQGFNPLGGNIEGPLVPNKNLLRRSDILNPFGEENSRGDANWANQKSELEHFAKLQQQEQVDKEKKKRQTSQFA